MLVCDFFDSDLSLTCSSQFCLPVSDHVQSLNSETSRFDHTIDLCEVHFKHRGRHHVYNLSAFSVYSFLAQHRCILLSKHVCSTEDDQAVDMT